MRNDRRYRRGAVLLFALLLVAGTARATETATAVIEQTTGDVLATLRDAQLTSAEKRTAIEAIVYARIDFETVSRLVLARNWRRLSKPQQQEFIDEFKKHLTVTYGDNVDRYRDEKVEITAEREEARGDRTVLTLVVSPNEEFSINYRLRQRQGTWLIIDIIIEGVSMVSNFRSQFQEIMANGGPEKLLQLLREKNTHGEPLKS